MNVIEFNLAMYLFIVSCWVLDFLLINRKLLDRYLFLISIFLIFFVDISMATVLYMPIKILDGNQA
ncbi:MAG: hypothetical protein UU94_C0004G0012 [Candidatus Collierbacteria bacterium GW2011_GWB2_42_12]|nr:MAG: hypothetical protein UU94_C0004G0012 [Candidatus Collierbacteria bacterium GW2011_GWB2_42_12]